MNVHANTLWYRWIRDSLQILYTLANVETQQVIQFVFSDLRVKEEVKEKPSLGPVRFANIMQEFNLLPHDFLKMPSVLTLRELYAQSFKELVEFEEKSEENSKILEKYYKALRKIQYTQANVVQILAQGVLELKVT